MSEPLQKVDSAIEGLASPVKEKKPRASSSVPGVYNIDTLRDEKTKIQVAVETQKTGWKINTPSSSVEDKEILKKMLTTPPVKRIDLHFQTGVTVTARNMKGVTIKDALDAMYKPNKKRADDELDKPYLEGFEWNGLRQGNTEDETKEEWTRLCVRLQSTPGVSSSGGGKKKKNKNKEEE